MSISSIHHEFAINLKQMSHFGKPAQPYSQEAFEWLKRRIEGKTVYCQLIKRDQYERIVSWLNVDCSALLTLHSH